MKLGILITGHPPDDWSEGHYGDFFAHLLKGCEFEPQFWPVVEDEFPTGPEDADAWLITGSKYGVYDRLDWIDRLKSLIRDIYAAGLPIVGVCFGHQIMAEALGGHAAKFEGGWSVGRVDYRLDTGKTIALNAWHQDQVIDPPPGTTTYLSTDFCKHAGLAYRDNALSMQPHPEFDRIYVEHLIKSRGKALPPEIRDRAAASLDDDLDTDWAAEVICKALKAGRANSA